LLAELLLETGDAAAALKEIEADLAAAPGRRNGLMLRQRAQTRIAEGR